MMDEVWSVEQFLAHLTLRGWRPVRGPSGDGIWSDEAKKGYIVFKRVDPANPLAGSPFRAGSVYEWTGDGLSEIRWQDLPADDLSKILHFAANIGAPL